MLQYDGQSNQQPDSKGFCKDPAEAEQLMGVGGLWTWKVQLAHQPHLLSQVPITTDWMDLVNGILNRLPLEPKFRPLIFCF